MSLPSFHTTLFRLDLFFAGAVKLDFSPPGLACFLGDRLRGAFDDDMRRETAGLKASVKFFERDSGEAGAVACAPEERLAITLCVAVSIRLAASLSADLCTARQTAKTEAMS